ncbi:MAG: hypothetical protein GY853_01530 [PVC group bacterium]|nr:hypothetical protein [PVC group bacterium]
MTLEERTDDIEKYIKQMNEMWTVEYLSKKAEEKEEERREYNRLYQRQNYSNNLKSMVRRKWPEPAKRRLLIERP